MTYPTPTAGPERPGDLSGDPRLKASERSRARYQLLAENMADVVTRIRLDGSSSYISPGIERLIGYTQREMFGRSAQHFTWPADRPLILRTFAEMAAGRSEATVVHRAQHKEGHPVWVETRFRLIRDRTGEPTEIIAVLRDISDRKAAEAALADSEERYRLIAHNARDIISRAELRGDMTYVSPAVEGILGYQPEEIIGGKVIPLIHPEDLEGFLGVYRDLASGERQGGQPVRYRMLHKDGRWIWIEGNPTLVHADDGAPTGFVDVCRDVTDQVALEAELTAARDAAEAGARAKSEFLANMSHELRTPLTAVIGFSGLLGVRPELSDDARRLAERIQTASRALLATINDVLDFSRLEAGQLQTRQDIVDLRRLVAEVLDVQAVQVAEKGLELEADIDPATPQRLVLDRERVRQVLANLLGNAVKFTPAGQVCVEVGHQSGQVRIAVRDTGPGLSAADRARLFQRFTQVDASSTRAHGGTGLGLAICKGLVQIMGGAIGVESEPGRGSTFWFTLPAPVA